MAAEWIKSMEREIKAHQINNTWTFVPPPRGPAKAGHDPTSCQAFGHMELK